MWTNLSGKSHLTSLSFFYTICQPHTNWVSVSFFLMMKIWIESQMKNINMWWKSYYILNQDSMVTWSYHNKKQGDALIANQFVSPCSAMYFLFSSFVFLSTSQSNQSFSDTLLSIWHFSGIFSGCKIFWGQKRPWIKWWYPAWHQGIGLG